MTPEEHDLDAEEQPRAETPVNLPPPPLVPVGPASLIEDDEERGEREEDEASGREAGQQ